MKIPMQMGEDVTESELTIPANTYTSVGTKLVRKCGKIVTINFGGSINGTLAGSNGLIATLPEGYRPSRAIIFHVFGTFASANGYYYAMIKTNGEIVTNTGGSTFTGLLGFDSTFIL